jgi:hypothetical protein
MYHGPLWLVLARKVWASSVKLSPGEMDNLDCIIMGRSVFVIDIDIGVVFLNIFYLEIY